MVIIVPRISRPKPPYSSGPVRPHQAKPPQLVEHVSRKIIILVPLRRLRARHLFADNLRNVSRSIGIWSGNPKSIESVLKTVRSGLHSIRCQRFVHCLYVERAANASWIPRCTKIRLGSNAGQACIAELCGEYATHRHVDISIVCPGPVDKGAGPQRFAIREAKMNECFLAHAGFSADEEFAVVKVRHWQSGLDEPLSENPHELVTEAH